MIQLVAGLLLTLPSQSISATGSSADYLSGIRLNAALNASLNAAWQNIEFRTLIRRIEEDRRIAVLLDRRIDPNRVLSFESSAQSTREALSELAESCDGRMVLVGSAAYVAPHFAAERLRTLVQLRTDEFTAAVRGRNSSGGRSRLFVLTDRNAVRWDDLDEPRAIVERIASRWKLSVEGAEKIPHDLWASATLPEANVVEALSLALNQFDLTFEWIDGAGGIRIVAVPERVAIEKRYTPRGVSAESAARRWSEEIEGLSAEASGREVVVRAFVEQHEQLEEHLKPGGANPGLTKTPRKKPGGTPLARRTFTLRTQAAPAVAILEKLKQSGLDVQFDAAKLKAAGVQTDKAISLDLDKATPAELFEAICRPIGAQFKISGETIQVTP